MAKLAPNQHFLAITIHHLIDRHGLGILDFQQPSEKLTELLVALIGQQCLLPNSASVLEMVGCCHSHSHLRYKRHQSSPINGWCEIYPWLALDAYHVYNIAQADATTNYQRTMMPTNNHINRGFTIAMASDHAGIELRQFLGQRLQDRGHEIKDLGPFVADSVDYPDYAAHACQLMLANEVDRVVLVCGSGIGMSMAANRYQGVRCALVHDETTARLSREHNNSNAIALGSRLTDPETAWTSLLTWLITPWEGGRHAQRVARLALGVHPPGRDLHRHRMMTQERQRFSTHHGYATPAEIEHAGLADDYRSALDRADALFRRLESADPELAQYAAPMAYRMRFYQWQNFRQLFWEAELRTVSQGHPDYRFIEQEKYRLVQEKFPLISSHILVDTNDYAFARRGTEEKIAEKDGRIMERLRRRPQ